MLEFAVILFMHLAPNEMAWCNALTTFLSKRGNIFDMKDSLRRRFGTALHQYQILMQVVNAEMDKQIGVARQAVLSQNSTKRDGVMFEVIPLPEINVTTPITHQLYVSALSSDGISIREPTTSTSSHGNPTVPNPHPCHTPSDYIHSHCPLCAGAGGGTGESKL